MDGATGQRIAASGIATLGKDLAVMYGAGKIGALIGTAIGGPVGALVGFVIGVGVGYGN